jgi:hypothetical protein
MTRTLVLYELMSLDGFAGFINTTTQKLVFSSTAPSLDWAKTTH